MPIPSYEDSALLPLTTDEEIRERVHDLVGRALRRQLWLMFLDEDDVQLPYLMPSDIPLLPEPDDAERISAFLLDLVDELAARAVVLVIERPGPPDITDADREWFRMLAEITARLAERGIAVRGPFLSTRAGVRGVAVEDYRAID